MEFYFLKAYDLSSYMDFTVGNSVSIQFFFGKIFQDFYLSIINGIGIIIYVCSFYISSSLFKIKVLYIIL